MKSFFFLLGIFLLVSCSTFKKNSKNSKEINLFLYKDPSGDYLLKREFFERNNKLQLRQQLLQLDGSSIPLEKSITIANIGFSKKRKSLSIRPQISQFSIWFEKKKYFSQMRINIKNKSLDLLLVSPEDKWNGKSSEKFIGGSVFCWFSQIPECLRRAKLLRKDESSQFSFVVVWDSYPYYTEQYQNISAKIFSKAIVKYDGVFKGSLKYNIQVDNQFIVYHFSESLKFEKMFWISQGISLTKNSN